MIKDILFLTLILLTSINSDFRSKNLKDFYRCFDQDTNDCSSAKIENKDIECCRFELVDIDNLNYFDWTFHIEYQAYNECKIYFKSYPSEAMEKQMEKLAKELFGFREINFHQFTPRLREIVNCSSSSMAFEYGGETNYTDEEIEILTSKNHCLYYASSKTTERIYNEKITITESKCFEAISLKETKDAGVTCSFIDMSILFKNGTKVKFNNCFLFPSEAIKNKKVPIIVEDVIKENVEEFANEQNQTVAEYDFKIIDKDGGYILYNSEKGIIEENGDFIININIIILIGLILLF